MAPLPDVKLRVMTQFPAAVRTGVGLAVEKKNGIYSFGLEYGSITAQDYISPDKYATSWQVYWDAAANDYVRIPYTLPTARVVGTSSTSETVDLGTKHFLVDPGLGWTKGTRVRGADDNDPSNFIEGTVQSYDPATGAVEISVDYSQGSGTVVSWAFGIAADSNIGTLTADTMAYAQSFNVKPSVTSIILNGWHTQGDGAAGTVWVKVDSPPSHDLYFETANGKYFALSTSLILPGMAGAKGDGVADDTTALAKWLAYPAAKRGSAGYYIVSGKLDLTDAGPIDFGNMILDGSAGGSFGTRAAILSSEGSITQISDLAANVTAKDGSLLFTNDHGLTADDIGIIYNPTDYSFSNAYTYSRAGEFFAVESITDSKTIKIFGGTVAGYTAANVDIYKMAKHEVIWSNVHIIAPNSGNVRPLTVRLSTRCVMLNVTSSGSNYAGFDFDRCYNTDLYGPSCKIGPLTPEPYGILIGNCQGFRVHGGELNASRHCVAPGGDDFPGSVPCRDINVSHAILRNDFDYQHVAAADVHANVDGIRYQSCVIYGGGSFGGKNVFYDDIDFIGGDPATGSLIRGGSYWAGGTASVTNSRFVGNPGANYTAGLIELFTDANNTNEDTTLILGGNTIVDMGATATLFRVDHGSSYKVNVKEYGTTIVKGASLSTILFITGSGPSDFVSMTKPTGAKNGAALFVAAGGFAPTSVSLPEQSGSVDITPVSGNAVATASVTFPLSYGSYVPRVIVSDGAGAVNSKSITSYKDGVSATGFSARIRTCDGTNMGVSSPNVPVDWIARLN